MKPLLLLLVWIAAACPAQSQTTANEFPKGAVIIERRNLPLGNTLKRALVLWMLRPEKHPNGYQADEPYTCPDYTRGSYYSGPARVSLIDRSTDKVIILYSWRMKKVLMCRIRFETAIITMSAHKPSQALKRSQQ